MVAFQTLLKQTVTLVENRVKDKSSDDPLKDLAFLSEHYRTRHEWDKANAATRHMLALAEGNLNSDFKTTPVDLELQLSSKSLRRLRSNKELKGIIIGVFVLTGSWFAAFCMTNYPQFLLDARAQIFALDPQTFVDRAKYFHNHNQLGKAIEECDKALALDQTNSDALQRKSSVLYALGKYQQALQINDLSNREKAPYYYNLSMIQAALGNHEAAALACEKANALVPDSGEIYSIAYEWASAGDPEKALRFAQLETTTSKTDYDKAIGLSQEARYLLKLSRYPEAIEAATKSTKVGTNPLISRAFTFRAEALYQMSSYVAAAYDANTAINMNRDDYRAYEIRAKCFDMLGRPSDAAADRHSANIWRNGRDI